MGRRVVTWRERWAWARSHTSPKAWRAELWEQGSLLAIGAVVYWRLLSDQPGAMDWIQAAVITAVFYLVLIPVASFLRNVVIAGREIRADEYERMEKQLVAANATIESLTPTGAYQILCMALNNVGVLLGTAEASFMPGGEPLHAWVQQADRFLRMIREDVTPKLAGP
jgi:hypothetical protein